jgi:uncharacterized protein YuzE
MRKKLSYDPKEDILYYNQGEKSMDSLDIGNMFIEFSGDNKVVGIEVLDASKFISDYTDKEFTKEALENIVEAEIKVFRRGEFAFVMLFFTVDRNGEKVKESIGVNVPSSTVAA